MRYRVGGIVLGDGASDLFHLTALRHEIRVTAYATLAALRLSTITRLVLVSALGLIETFDWSTCAVDVQFSGRRGEGIIGRYFTGKSPSAAMTLGSTS